MDVLDQITLTGLRAFGHHGVLPHEREDGQDFVVDVTLHLSTHRAARTDDLADTVNYGEVAERVAGLVARDPVDLLETLVARIADDLLASTEARRVTVTVHKPSAPIAVAFTDVAVTIQRDRPGAGS